MSVDVTRLDFMALLRSNPTIRVLTVGLCDTFHDSLGDFGELLWRDQLKAVPPPATANGKKRKGWARKERKRRERAEQEEYERKRVEVGDSCKTFLSSLRLFELFDRRGTDVCEEYAAKVLKSRPHLRFDGDGQIWDGAKVDSAQMDLVDEYPVTGDFWEA